MTLFVVYNPVCGDRTAEGFFHAEVLPRLKEHGKVPDEIIATTHPNHAGEVIVDFLKRLPESETITVILGSGDGTLHEIATALHHSLDREKQTQISIILVPCGTANALYSSLFPAGTDGPAYRLRSLELYLSPSATSTINLAAATTTIHSPLSGAATRSSVAVVVASTSLHAAILHDSEALRPTYPGIERFKVAAQANITRWYHAYAKLLPLRSGESKLVEVYDIPSQQFVTISDSHSGVSAGGVELEGPFSYFLSTVNVDRLEPAFRITPLHRTFPPESPALDVAIVRPLTDPTVQEDSEESRSRFAAKAGAIMGGAYRDGAHVNMTYDVNGTIQEQEHGGQAVVEYYRCGGWEWTPNLDDEHAHFVCVDGEILNVEKGGKAITLISRDIKGTILSLYA